MEIELAKLKQELNDERQARARAEALHNEVSQKLEEALLAYETILKELKHERRASPSAESSKRIAASVRTIQSTLAKKKLSCVEGELGATRLALDEEREHSKRIQSEASKRRNKFLRCLEGDINVLNAEIEARICAQKCAWETVAKAQDEIAEAIWQSSVTTNNLLTAQAELEATRKTLTEERTPFLSQLTCFPIIDTAEKAQVDTAENAPLDST